MILDNELDALTEDEISLLYYVVSDGNTKPEKLEFIKSVRKEGLVQWFMLNQNKLTDTGKKTYQSLIEKLITYKG